MRSDKQLRLIQELKQLSDQEDFFARRGQDFENENSCVIWTGAEETFKDGVPIADHYEHYEHAAFTQFLKKNKLSYEWHDAGTILIYEDTL